MLQLDNVLSQLVEKLGTIAPEVIRQKMAYSLLADYVGLIISGVLMVAGGVVWYVWDRKIKLANSWNHDLDRDFLGILVGLIVFGFFLIFWCCLWDIIKIQYYPQAWIVHSFKN